jgi:hypothetical protein
MSLNSIEASIEKLAIAAAQSVFKTVGKSLMHSNNLKSIGTKAAIGAGAGGVFNVATGNKDEGIATRFAKGAVGGGLVGGGYGAAKVGLKAYGAANKGFRATGAFSKNPNVKAPATAANVTKATETVNASHVPAGTGSKKVTSGPSWANKTGD